MTLSQVLVDDFPGLNWLTDPEDSGFSGAEICLDVDFEQPGMLRCRGGTDQFITETSNAAAMVTTGDGFAVYWGDSQNEVKIYNLAGTEIGSTNAQTGSLTTFSKPSAEWVITGDNAGPLQYWDGAAWANIAGSPEAYLVATWKDRVVAAREIGVQPYRVNFSEPGDPTTWGSFVDLNPGDQEPISALIPWRDYLFVFKASRFYVFHSISTNQIGESEFNYRTIDTGVGSWSAILDSQTPSTQYAAATTSGVVFSHDTGVYITTGDTPRKISQVLDPWFDRDDNVPGTEDVDIPLRDGHSDWGGVAALGDLVWYTPGLTTPASTPMESGRSFVWHVPSGRWGVTSFPVLSAIRRQFSTPTDLWGSWAQVSTTSRDFTTDDVTAIAPKYRSNKSDLGSPNVKTVRKLELNGQGTADLTVLTDLGTTDAGTSTVTMDATSGRGQQSYSRRGTFFRHQIEGDGTLEVSRLSYYVRAPRVPGVGVS